MERSDAGSIVRIFRNAKAAAAWGMEWVSRVPKAEAIHAIRQQVIRRASSVCERCGKVLIEKTGQMHETIPRSKGGEISLRNCEWLCYDCHQGKPDSAHGNRRTRFGEGKDGDSSM